MGKEERDAKAREIEARWGVGKRTLVAWEDSFACTSALPIQAIRDLAWLAAERERLVKCVTELHEENERLKGGAR